ncbi:MAG: hypothetical protein ACQEWV_15410 [Bacillota bacterium]
MSLSEPHGGQLINRIHYTYDYSSLKMVGTQFSLSFTLLIFDLFNIFRYVPNH